MPSRKDSLMNGASVSALRDLILAVGPPPPHAVDGLLLGEQQLYVRSMTGAERDLLEETVTGLGDDEGARRRCWRGRFCAGVLCDAEGNRLFTFADSEVLNELDSEFLERVIIATNEHNRFGQTGVVASEKNLPPAPSESSTSASPKSSAGP